MKVTFVDHRYENIATTNLDVLPQPGDNVEINYKSKVDTYIVFRTTWIILTGVPWYQVMLNTGGH